MRSAGSAQLVAIDASPKRIGMLGFPHMKLARTSQLTVALFGMALVSVDAGEVAPSPYLDQIQQEVVSDPFERAIRPITNPALFDLAVPRTQLHPFVMHQRLSRSIQTRAGDLDLGGDFQLYGLQLEYAFNDRFSLTALKDGYIDLNPDHTLSEETGFANLTAGFKWVCLLDAEDKLAISLSGQVEVPTGNSDVFQGTGDGAIIPTISVLKLYDRFQFAESLGVRLPFDNDEESTMLFYSAHVSYQLTETLFPLIELNYFRVLDEGDGGRRFNSQVGGAVPAVADFEGGDLINLGAANASENRDLLTLGLGMRWRINDHVDFGAAYEIPLTDKSANLMRSRITADFVYRF